MVKTAQHRGEVKNTTRPPIVVVMGHIDHGKTTILDYFRNTKVVEKESGGITQHIGAYEVEHHLSDSGEAKKITFIDTPGHEAFSQIRSRGARVADIAVLVIAAEEGLKPQTEEAIGIIRGAELPFIVAINKVDKPEAQPERVRRELADAGILVESYGGKVPSIEVSAKTGHHMDALLELILLLAEVEHITAEPEKPAEGVVIDVHRDSRRGIASTLLIRDGTFRKEQVLVIGRSVESVKILEDFRGEGITRAAPSAPAVVAGLSRAPAVGDAFRQFSSRGAAEKYAASLPDEKVPSPPVYGNGKDENGEKPVFNVIVKADGAGSKEALEEALGRFHCEKIGLRILRSEIGDINESDVKLAQATHMVTIIGFKVKVDTRAREIILSSGVHVITGEVIYDLLDQVKNRMEHFIPCELKRTDLGRAKILKVFTRKGNTQIVGGRVEEGAVRKGARLDIRRDQEIIGKGIFSQLQREKMPCEEVGKGHECGMSVESATPIQEGDVLLAYTEEEITQSL